MSDEKKRQFKPSLDNFPRPIIFIRWLLLAAEGILGLFLVSTFRFEFVILYLSYGIVSLFLLLPLIRCVRCGYYGKRCNFGWGVWVSKIFPRDEKNSYPAFYGYSIIFWPLRLLPILAGLKVLPMILSSSFPFMPHSIFGLYLIVIFIHRKFYRASSCSRCQMRESCPVYDSRAVLIDQPEKA